MTDPQDHIDSYFDHKYLRWFNLCGKPALIKITRVDRKVEMTLPGGSKAVKPVIHFDQVKGSIDDVKPLVLNVTNKIDMIKILGTPSVKAWIGREVVLFQTERMCKGRMVEAIGVRAKKEQK